MRNWLRPEPFFKKKKIAFYTVTCLKTVRWVIASDKQVFSNKHAAADAVRHCGKMPFDDVPKKIYREKSRPFEKRIHLPSEHVYVRFPSQYKPMDCVQVHRISKERKLRALGMNYLSVVWWWESRKIKYQSICRCVMSGGMVRIKIKSSNNE